jgi:hypothetical protein
VAGTLIFHPTTRVSIPIRSGAARFGRRMRASLRKLMALACLAGAVAFAQSADRRGLNGYEAALRETSMARQIASLENFLSVGGNGPLTTSALELLVWDYLRSGAPARAARPAKALLAIDSGNALALAALVDPRVGSPTDGDRFRMATRGVAEFGRLPKPVGMRGEEFFRLRLLALNTLEGEAGLGYLQQKNYAAAQQYLRQAVASSPNNTRYVYGLALAMLEPKPPQDEGYWFLARAVNLSRGTPRGAEIAEFARRRYVDAGGSESNWNRFLAVTAVSTFATSSNVARSTAPGAIPRPPNSTPAAASPSGTVQSASLVPPAGRANSAPAPSLGLQLPPIRKNVFIPRDHPLSLGILIQKARLTSEDRNAIIFSLSDLVRHLRQDDEVFVMGFGKELEFEQDLTRNNKLLEEAIAGIKPQSGAALLDAVAFAAGHLDRIAKNRSRVLLVIADGHDAAPHVSSSEINGVLGRVRVDCIGLNVDDAAGMNMLQSLAADSGGKTSFASSPQQFRTATWEFAKSMGIEFPY